MSKLKRNNINIKQFAQQLAMIFHIVKKSKVSISDWLDSRAHCTMTDFIKCLYWVIIKMAERGNLCYDDAHNPKYGDPVDVPLIIATEVSIKGYGEWVVLYMNKHNWTTSMTSAKVILRHALVSMALSKSWVSAQWHSLMFYKLIVIIILLKLSASLSHFTFSALWHIDSSETNCRQICAWLWCRRCLDHPLACSGKETSLS